LNEIISLLLCGKAKCLPALALAMARDQYPNPIQAGKFPGSNGISSVWLASTDSGFLHGPVTQDLKVKPLVNRFKIQCL
jgi:hypothetical protein